MLKPHHVVVLCGLMMSLSAFSIDITLPLFKVISTDLGVPVTTLPLTITIYLLCLGVGQLFFGSLSDRFGRLPILLIGMVIFLIGGIACAMATTMETLLMARALQGFGGAAPYILSRAIIRDLYQGVELAKKMALATGIFSIGPLIAPLFGAAVLELGGSWRWVFAVMCLYAGGMLLVARRMTEPNQSPDKNALKVSRLMTNLRTVLSHPQSRTFMTMHAIISVSMILIIATAATIYGNAFGIYGTAFALYFAIHGLGIIIGQFLNHKLLDRFGVIASTQFAAAVMLTSCLLICLMAITNSLTPLKMSLAMILYAVGFLTVIANATSMSLQPHGSIVGFTAALIGTVSSSFSGLTTSLISPFVQHSVIVWSLAVAAPALIVLIMLVRWQAKSRHA